MHASLMQCKHVHATDIFSTNPNTETSYKRNTRWNKEIHILYHVCINWIKKQVLNENPLRQTVNLKHRWCVSRLKNPWCPFDVHFGYRGQWKLATSIIIGYSNNTFNIGLLDSYGILVNTQISLNLLDYTKVSRSIVLNIEQILPTYFTKSITIWKYRRSHKTLP